MPSGEIVTTSTNNLNLTACGKYTITVRAYNPNVMHLIATYKKDFIIDLNDPTILINGVKDNGLYSQNVTPLITIEDNDGLLKTSQLFERATISLKRDDSPVTFKNGTALTKEGTYILTASVTDLAGKTASKSVSFVIDKTAPTLTIAGATDGGVYYDTVTLNFSTNASNLRVENENGQDYTLNNNKLTLSGVEGQSKVYLINACVSDGAGNQTIKKMTITIDLLPVSFIVTGIYEGQILTEMPSNIACLVQDGSQESVIQPKILVGSNGAHTLQLSYVKGEHTYSKNINFIIDYTAPEITNKIVKLDDETKSTAFLAKKASTLFIQVDINDSETDIREVYAKVGHLATRIPMIPSENNDNQYSLEYTFGEGNFKDLEIKVVAINEAGLSKESTLNYVTLDNIAPVVNYYVTPVNLSYGLNGYFTDPSTKVELATADETATIHYILNSGTVKEYTDAVTLTEGINTLFYYAEDKVGNVSETKIRIIKFDKTAPNKPTNVTPEDSKLAIPMITIKGDVLLEGGKIQVLLLNKII